MDYLLTIEPEMAKAAYFQVTDLLDLEVDLLFFDYPANRPAGSAAGLTLAA